MALLLSLYHSKGRWLISNLAESPVLLRATTRRGPRERVSALRTGASPLRECSARPQPDSIVDLGLAGHAAAPGDCGPFRAPAPGSAGPEAPHGENLRGRSASPTGPYAALHEAFGHEPHLRLRRMSLVYRAFGAETPTRQTSRRPHDAMASGALAVWQAPIATCSAGCHPPVCGGVCIQEWLISLRRVCRPHGKLLWHPLPTLIGEGTKR
jgi:hypothetical protein